MRTDPAPTWAGKSPQQRRDERRRRLLDAALDAFGTEGYAASSINRICKAARVTERDLYREFGGKPGLLIAVHGELMARVLAAVDAALAQAPLVAETRVQAALDAFTATLTEDPRAARVNFLEVVGAHPDVEAHRREVVAAFGAVLGREWQRLAEAGAAAAPRRELTVALVGAAQEALVDWVAAPDGRPREQVVDALVELYLAVLRGV